ncbi:hypothetical protein [Anaeromyxobacter dehalogenans]|nr:hypothetical protein [Anaeromyxobacter dehalogenans]
MSRTRLAVLSTAFAVVAAGVFGLGFLRGAAEASAAPAPPPLSSEYPGGAPIDAARIQTGRLTFDRMPAEVSGALELHSAEIVKQAEVLATKQARITGTCAPGSAIRVVAQDGTVVCQRFPRGVVSVSSLAGVPRVSTTATTQLSVPGGVGRYQSGGEDDFLVLPVDLPDGAVVTGFSFVFWDSDARIDGAAYLYRSDDTAMAALVTKDAAEEVRVVSTQDIAAQKVDNGAFAYFVYLQLSAAAGPRLVPIAASVAYKLP